MVYTCSINGSPIILVLYVGDLFNMAEAKSLGVLLPSYLYLAKLISQDEMEAKAMKGIPYASSCGSLIYVIITTRSDIAYAVRVVSCNMANPRKIHWEAVKCVLLKGVT